MTHDERKKLDTLKRRARHLAGRIDDPQYKGNLDPTRRELGALRWAISIVEGQTPPPGELVVVRSSPLASTDDTEKKT